MEEQFKNYLTECGYSVTTPSGNHSTVYDYAKRINRVCEWEDTTWVELAENINRFVALYDEGGAKEEEGRKSKRAVINALKRFQEFLAAEVRSTKESENIKESKHMKEQLENLVKQGQDFTLQGVAVAKITSIKSDDVLEIGEDFIKIGISYKKGELRAYQIIPFTSILGITGTSNVRIS